MKLYLSSFGLGDKPEELLALTGDAKHTALILNALDNEPEARDDFRVSQTEALSKLGFVVEDLDLRTYFGRRDALQALLESKELVWINGGNTFILRRAMKQSGFDSIISKRVKEGSIVYAGFSAAATIATPDLHGADITDDPIEVPAGYEPETIWDGLGFVDFAIAVHYNSDHPESQLTDKEIAYYKRNLVPFKTLRDGQVLIRRGNDIYIVG